MKADSGVRLTNPWLRAKKKIALRWVHFVCPTFFPFKFVRLNGRNCVL